MSSVHDKLDRVRKPRVHIKAEVETEGAKLVYDLPFVVGVMGDFSGDPTGELKPLEDRGFVEIDRDNIDDVLKRMKPGLNLRVENTLKGDGSEMAVQLKFESMDDFEPINVARQVEPLKKLLDTRDKLRDLMTKVDLSSELENVLEDILKDTEGVSKLAGELGIKASGDASEGGE
jgi:type VI secretion system protein ImpB